VLTDNGSCSKSRLGAMPQPRPGSRTSEPGPTGRRPTARSNERPTRRDVGPGRAHPHMAGREGRRADRAGARHDSRAQDRRGVRGGRRGPARRSARNPRKGMTAAVLRRVIATWALPLRPSAAWPAVLDLLGSVLTAAPDRRPAAADLALELRRAPPLDGVACDVV
jgi:hypothetical protein